MAISSADPTPDPFVTRGTGMFLIAVSVSVLIGWTFDVSALKGLSGDITMKANAALALLALGVALFVLTSERRSARILGRTSAVFAGLLGALTLSEHLVGWNLGIDELVFHELPGAAGTTSPGRMGPNASVSLTLAGFALWLLHRGRARDIARAQVIGACITIFALVPLVGYLYGATQFYAVARYTGIAVHTGIALLALSGAILAAYHSTGPVAALRSDAPHSVIARRLLAQAIVLPLLLGYLQLAGERQGFYDSRFGTSAFVVAIIVLFSITTWRTTLAIGRSEDARRAAQQERDELLLSERAARERAERADRAKDEFIAAVSHELRTPLNAIVGWTQMLRQGSLTDSTRTKAMNAVSRNGNALARLIEDLLDRSRIATGHLEIAKTPVDVNAIVQAAAESVLPIAETKQVTLTVEPAPVSPIVIGDAPRLQQVLLNVLSNAVKFTEAPGAVHVGVDCNGHAVTVQVRDEGIGIDPAFLPRVFEQFEQGSAATPGDRGLGLGLHIAKHLVERHGGSIHAHSAGVGQGALFTIQLPLAEQGVVTRS